MQYIILDLEWNQAISPARMIRTPVMLHGEIIQIGAIKTDDKFNLVDKIKLNIRPKYYKKMNPHVKKLTGITQAQLTAGESFPQAFKRFRAWCGEESRFITWGFDDLNMLSDNLALHGLDTGFGSDYINLQLIYNRQTSAEHLQCALAAAAESLNIPIDVQVHDAFNDAFLTFELCRKLDMAQGIANYADYAAAIPTPLVKDVVTDVDDLKTITFNTRVVDIPCPKCGRELKMRQWLFSSAKSCKTIAKCDNCGEFLIKLKAARITDDNYTITRSVYEATEDDINTYNEKLKKREKRKKRAKSKTEDKIERNEKNGDV